MLKGNAGAVAGQLPGAGGVSIGAGFVGQVVEQSIAVGSAVALTTATPLTVTSISLTAGNWVLYAQIDFNLAAATTTILQGGPSGVTNTLTPQPGGSGIAPDALAIQLTTLVAVTGVYGIASKPTYYVHTGTNTVYLVAQATFSAGTVSAFGTITAIRYA